MNSGIGITPDAREIADAIRYAADRLAGYTPGQKSSGQIFELICALADTLDKKTQTTLLSLMRERYNPR